MEGEMVEQIIEYIRKKYRSLSVILYGSFADGTNREGSDFDALVISSDHEKFHDTSIVGGVQLDVFVYPASYFEQDYGCADFVQIYDGRIVSDSEDIGKTLLAKVRAYMDSRARKTDADMKTDLDWCIKMLNRTERGDAEGMFRWHLLLVESPEIFCDLMEHPYFGPKKTLRWMKATHPAAYDCYERALSELNRACLEDWIAYLKRLYEARTRRQ